MDQVVVQSPSSVADEPAEDAADFNRLPLIAVNRAKDASVSGMRRPWLRVVLRKVRWVSVVALCVAVGGVVGLYFQPSGLQFVMNTFGLEPGAGTSTPIAVRPPAPMSSAVAGPARPESVIGLGRLLPSGDLITVAPPSGAGDARIATIYVDEGDRVIAGQLVAVLDNESRLKRAVAAAEAMVGLREADLVRTQVSVKASLQEAKAALVEAEAVAQEAGLNLERARSLYARRTVSKAAIDKAEADAARADAAVEQARARLTRYAGVLEDQSDVVYARRSLDVARSDLAVAEENLEQSYVRAPIAGTLLSLHLQPGEKPGSDGIMVIGNIDQMTVDVEIYQADIAAVSVGDSVEITADAFDGVLIGAVTEIGLEVKRQSVIGADPAANTDARVVDVTVVLDEQSSARASRFSNLQVRAAIEVDPS